MKDDAYFQTLRAALLGLPPAEVEDIVREMAAHADEKAEIVGKDAALRALGDPRDLASLYLADRLTSAPARPSPGRALRAARLIAGRGVKGLALLTASIAGYGFGLLLVAMALYEPFAPAQIGLWVVAGDDPSFSLGRTRAPIGEDVLGGWIIPIGALLGATILYLTWRLGLSTLRSIIGTGLHRPAR
jgi:hypothetical protein